jgi:hypothetical protein
MKFEKFVPLTKMEEQTDGTLFVYGTVTAEQPDLENEVCDYAGTKPFFQAKTASMFKLTSAVDGMTPSIMPMREMHQLKAIGAGRTIDFDDANKAIKMGFQVVDPVSVLKFKTGVLIGFSQGGAYVGELVADPKFPGCKRYVADPAEVSAVDSPCLPQALVETMKGRTVTLAKAAGVTEQVPLQILGVDQARLIKMERELAILQELLKEKKTKRVDGEDLTSSCFAFVGDPEDTSTWKLPIKFSDEEKTKTHIRNALARFGQTEGMSEEEKKAAKRKIMAAAKEHGIDVSDTDKAAIGMVCAKISLEKGLYQVGDFASLIENLHWLCLQAEWERDYEDDGSKVPGGMREAWLSLLAEFKAMAVEEADELAAEAGKGEKGMKITDQAGLTKAAKTVHDHLEKLAEMHKAQGEHMKKSTDAMEEKHKAVGEHIEKCMKAAKDAMEGNEPEPGEKGDKAMEAQMLELKKSLADLVAKLAATPATGGAHSGNIDPLAKTATGFEELEASSITH